MARDAPWVTGMLSNKHIENSNLSLNIGHKNVPRFLNRFLELLEPDRELHQLSTPLIKLNFINALPLRRHRSKQFPCSRVTSAGCSCLYLRFLCNVLRVKKWSKNIPRKFRFLNCWTRGEVTTPPLNYT